MNDPKTCEHNKFSAQVHVRRSITDGVTSFVAEVRVQCSECHSPMHFDPDQVNTSIKGEQVHIVMIPPTTLEPDDTGTTTTTGAPL